MTGTEQLHDAGQSIWLDNITRALLASGGLQHYITRLSVTGLTSNPTIFEQAIKNAQTTTPRFVARARMASLVRRSSSSLPWKI